jgi:hypothetical protein
MCFLVITASCYLTSMRRSITPTILGIRGSLRCVALLLLLLNVLGIAALFTHVGATIGTAPPPPFGGTSY